MEAFYKKYIWLGIIAIVLLTFAAYSSAIRGEFVWDDGYHVLKNPLLTAPDGLWQIWTTTKTPQYYPLTFTTFWVEHLLWGFNPIGYHLVNVFLHAVNAVIVFWLLRRLKVPGAWMIGAVFAVHPVHVESVAWISERKNVLSALFYLLSIGCYLEYESKRLPDGQAGDRQGQTDRWGWYAGTLGLFILGLLSKTVVATLPVALLLIRYLKGWRIGRRELSELVPFFMIGGAMGLLTMWYEVQIVGALGKRWNMSMMERLLIAGRALAFYVVKLIWPADLTFNYPRWQLDIRDPVQWGWVIGAGIYILVFWWKRREWGRGPFVGLAFFTVTLFPGLGFFNIFYFRYSFVADHFQYLASLGIIALIIGGAAWGFDKWIRSDLHGGDPRLERVKPVLGSLVLAILMALTWKQGLIYHDPKTLWLDTIKKNPDSYLAHNNLGAIYEDEGRLDDAIQEYLTVLSIKPNDTDAHNNLGTVYGKQGKLDAAIREYLTALRLKPNKIQTHYNLGNVYKVKGLKSQARKEYEANLELNPDFSPAREALESLNSPAVNPHAKK